MNYFVRTTWVIVICTTIIAVPTIVKNGIRLPGDKLFHSSNRGVLHFGIILAISLLAVHIIFH